MRNADVKLLDNATQRRDVMNQLLFQTANILNQAVDLRLGQPALKARHVFLALDNNSAQLCVRLFPHFIRSQVLGVEVLAQSCFALAVGSVAHGTRGFVGLGGGFGQRAGRNQQ